MTQEELNEILKNHQHWIRKDVDNWEDLKADLSGADLSGVDLGGESLSRANLSNADLRSADLRSADLRCADLRSADLGDANLSSADLRCADLGGADLGGANLSSADLRSADLRSADLGDANLSSADLRSAYLGGAYLGGANLRDTKGLYQVPPSHGAFIGWKKARRGVIVKLMIPEDAIRSSGTDRKCRCDKAQVLEFQNENGDILRDLKYATSKHDNHFRYVVGSTVTVENFDDDRFNECAPGIHFFVTREEAVNY